LPQGPRRGAQSPADPITDRGEADVSPRTTTSAFDLPEHLAAKADPALIAADERHFAAIAESLQQTIDDLSERLDAARKAPGGSGQQALDRDQEVHRLTARLRTLRRFGLDLCLGHMVDAEDGRAVFVGRLGLTDAAGRRLLVDWRSPAAEPFFGATHANPMGLASRRRYRWSGGRISDYWDEVFTLDGLDGKVALDDQSAFIASLGSSRSDRMRDVLATIQTDQDAIIRAGSRGALVVDGGPGTGKTVVALHRAAYLLYSDPRLGHHRGGVLFVGPSRPYLAYVGDVLPSLGEEGVQTCTVTDLVPEGATAAPELDPEVARLKSSAAMVAAIEPAVRFYEEPPTEPMEVETPYADLWLSTADWADAFDAPAPGTPHNEARDEVWEELLTILADKYDGDEGDDEESGSVDLVRASLTRNRALAEAFDRAWPIVEAADLVGDLWSVPAYLRLCAPWLDRDQLGLLQREDAQAWTVSDLPLLDAARQRLGDPEASRRRRRHEAAIAAERAQMDRVVDELLQLDDEDGMIAQLRQDGIRDALVDQGALPDDDTDLLAGPFAHVVVDEAQELTDAEWQMLLVRCPSRSFTVVGDRAQARHGFTESWQERLERVGLTHVDLTSLSINYRTPAEIMAEAEPAIRVVLPDANVPTSVRATGQPVIHGPVADRDAILDSWLAAHPDGIACVIGDPSFEETARVRSLTPELSKGLEFDLVVLVDPEDFGTGVEGAVDRYVAMTRATQQLVVLTSR
jgi:DNA helicase IV